MFVLADEDGERGAGALPERRCRPAGHRQDAALRAARVLDR